MKKKKEKQLQAKQVKKILNEPKEKSKRKWKSRKMNLHAHERKKIIFVYFFNLEHTA